MLTKKEIIEKMPNKYYKIIDLYEDYGVIDRAIDILNARRVKNKHIEDCDGECNVIILEYKLINGHYICKREVC